LFPNSFADSTDQRRVAQVSLLRPGISGFLKVEFTQNGSRGEGESGGKITMRTRVSTKGQVVLPNLIWRRLGISAGDSLDISIESGSVILTPLKKSPRKTRIVTDPITGLSALSAGADALVLRSKDVEEILARFP
jgi:AbrB family looped-hinge helix DNA binding protein